MPKSRDFLTRFGSKLDIPREVLPGSFGLTLAGQGELVVRGCKKILSYGERCISLRVGKTVLSIQGEGLLCAAFGSGCVTITGQVASLTFGEVTG